MGRTRFSVLLAIVCGLIAAGATAAPALALTPSVETLPASAVAETGATLNAKINPNGLETNYFFEYGTTASYGSKTAEVSAGSGSASIEKNQVIGSLTKNTVYHYRIVASNSAGSSQGVDKTFTTVGSPAVSSESAEPESSGGAATLKASVDPNGQSTTYQFEYGTESGTYTQVVPVPAEPAGNGYEPIAVSCKITGLTAGTTYYWRLSATNASGKVSGTEVSFLSSSHPGIQMSPVSGVWRTGATLNATVQPHLSTTVYWFEYGTTTSYGSKTATKEVKSEVESAPVSELISGLKANTLYHYRLVAQNGAGAHTGTDQTFTTSPNVTLSVKGTALKIGAPLKVFGTNLKFTTEEGLSHSCQEIELSGEVTENPGALQSVATLKMQNTGGAGCEYIPESPYKIKYSIPTGKPTLEYSINERSEGVVRTGKFVLIGTTYYSSFKTGECEYSAELSGTFPFGKTPLEATLTGKLETVKAIPSSALCFRTETLSGSATVTSSGENVETSH